LGAAQVCSAQGGACLQPLLCGANSRWEGSACWQGGIIIRERGEAARAKIIRRAGGSRAARDKAGVVRWSPSGEAVLRQVARVATRVSLAVALWPLGRWGAEGPAGTPRMRIN
jgi:hypothetical protein